MNRRWLIRSAVAIAFGLVGCAATHDADPEQRLDESDVKSPHDNAADDVADAGQDSASSCDPGPGNSDAGPGVDAGPKPDAGPADAGVFCQGTPFSLALTIPMPSNYVLAGFAAGSYERGIAFVTNASPPLAVAHAVSRLVVGDMTVSSDGAPTDTLYKPQATTIGIVSPNGASWLSPWRLMQGASSTSGLPYYMVSGTDGPNVQDRTKNLPPLGADTVLTATDGRNDAQTVRVGPEVYTWTSSTNSWTRVAAIGSDSSGWKGLAIIQPAYGNSITGRYIFTQAKVTSGGAGIVEQYWPNALPSSAGAPTVVSTATDAVPVGVRSNGCELYAIRGNPGAYSVLVYRR